MTKQKRKRRSWKQWGVWAAGVFGACMIITTLMQSAGLIPTTEELQQTETAEVVQLAALPTLMPTSAPASDTPQPSPTIPTDTAVPTEADKPTPTLTSTNTPRPTEPSPTPSIVPTATDIPPPSRTPLPSNTPDPNQAIKDLVNRQVAGEVLFVHFGTDFAGVNEVSVDWEFSENIFGSDIPNVKRELLKVACALRDSGLVDNHRIGMSIWIDVIDNLGNESTIIGANAVLEWSTITQVNCANAELLDISTFAEQFVLHPLIE